MKRKQTESKAKQMTSKKHRRGEKEVGILSVIS